MLGRQPKTYDDMVTDPVFPFQVGRSVALRLPEPMLARSGPIPGGAGWTFEPKLDGFQCLVCTHAVFRARSRRGRGMTHLLPEFSRCIPEGVPK